jgi:hypothetical protein
LKSISVGEELIDMLQGMVEMSPWSLARERSWTNIVVNAAAATAAENNPAFDLKA